MTRDEAMAKAALRLDDLIEASLARARDYGGPEVEEVLRQRLAEWRAEMLVQVTDEIDDYFLSHGRVTLH